MKCNKMTKFGVTLASMAVLGTLQALPETIVPVLGSQVVRADDEIGTVRVDIHAFEVDRYSESLAVDYSIPGSYASFVEAGSLIPTETVYLQKGESITVNHPMINGYSYSSFEILNTSDKSAVLGESNNVILSYELLTDAIKNTNSYHLNFLYTKKTDQAPSVNNNTNTGGDQTDGSTNSGETTPVTPPAGNGASAETPNTPETPDNGNTGTVESPTTPDQPNTGSNQSEDTGKEMDGAPIDYIIEYDIWDAENSRVGGNLDNIPVKKGTINPGEVIDAGVDIPGYTPRDSTLVSYETLYPFLKGTGEKLENGHWLRYWVIWYVKDEQPSVPTQPEDSKNPDQDPVNNGNANTDGGQTGGSTNGSEATLVTPPAGNGGEMEEKQRKRQTIAILEKLTQK